MRDGDFFFTTRCYTAHILQKCGTAPGASKKPKTYLSQGSTFLPCTFTTFLKSTAVDFKMTGFLTYITCDTSCIL